MPELAEDGDRLHRERLVQLEQVDVGELPADLLGDAAHGFDRRHQHELRREAARRLADDARERRQAERLRAFGRHDDERGRAVVDAGRVARGHRAVLLERRLERRQRFGGRVGADRLVAIDDDRRALLLRDRDRQDFVRERALGGRLRGLADGCAPRTRPAPRGRRGSARRRLRRTLPMWQFSNAHHRPSLIIESTSSPLPMRRPSRTRGSRYGQLLIDSMPPATATSMSPTRMAWSASITAFSPEPHTLLIVSAATWSGSPPLSAACRAGFWPSPALTRRCP